MLERSGWDSNSGFCWCRLQLGLLSSGESELLGWSSLSRGVIMRPQKPYCLVLSAFPHTAIPQFLPPKNSARITGESQFPRLLFYFNYFYITLKFCVTYLAHSKLWQSGEQFKKRILPPETNQTKSIGYLYKTQRRYGFIQKIIY